MRSDNVPNKYNNFYISCHVENENIEKDNIEKETFKVAQPVFDKKRTWAPRKKDRRRKISKEKIKEVAKKLDFKGEKKLTRKRDSKNDEILQETAPDKKKIKIEKV